MVIQVTCEILCFKKGFKFEYYFRRCFLIHVHACILKHLTSTCTLLWGTIEAQHYHTFQCDDEALRDAWLKTITDQIKELRDIGLRLENPHWTS